MSCTIDKLRTLIAHRPLACGAHGEEDAAWCILEAHSQCAGIDWTDDPILNRTFDFRPVNDIPVSENLRGEWMPRVMEAYEGALDWPLERQIAVVSKIVKLTIEQLNVAAEETWVAEWQAWEVRTADEGKIVRVVQAAAGEAAWAAKCVAEEEAEMASRAKAGEPWAGEATDAVFVKACKLWIEAAS